MGYWIWKGIGLVDETEKGRERNRKHSHKHTHTHRDFAVTYSWKTERGDKGEEGPVTALLL